MDLNKMKQIDSKFAFPLFTHQGKTGYIPLGNKKNIPNIGGGSSKTRLDGVRVEL